MTFQPDGDVITGPTGGLTLDECEGHAEVDCDDYSVWTLDFTRCGPPDPSRDLVGFPAGCMDLPNAEMRDYLTGRACVPDEFDRYDPQVTQTEGGQRMCFADGGCSAPTGNTGRSINFRMPCKTHDYGYDLMRERIFGENGPRVEAARKDADDLFRDDLSTHCGTRHWGNRPTCRSWAYTYAEVVEGNSLRQGYDIP